MNYVIMLCVTGGDSDESRMKVQKAENSSLTPASLLLKTTKAKTVEVVLEPGSMRSAVAGGLEPPSRPLDPSLGRCVLNL